MFRKIVLAAMLAASLGSIATPASAVIDIRVGPPPPRVETIPERRHGYVWVAGHWEWRHHHHEWVSGAWIRERHGYRYNQPVWVERDGRWHMVHGNWSRGDADGDGVPNGHDREPNNPYRH